MREPGGMNGLPWFLRTRDDAAQTRPRRRRDLAAATLIIALATCTLITHGGVAPGDTLGSASPLAMSTLSANGDTSRRNTSESAARLAMPILATHGGVERVGAPRSAAPPAMSTLITHGGVARTAPPGFAAPPAMPIGAAVHRPKAETAPPADALPTWVWPGGIADVVRAYERPPHEYGPGHRGIDVGVAGSEIVAPDDGIVAFRGVVVDRPLITIDHGGGFVSTLEPVESELSPGDVVARGESVGTLAEGGHAPPATVHLGARVDGEYINPLTLLGAAERPVLLPCCAALG